MKSLNEQVVERLLEKFGDSVQIDFKDERGDGKHFFVQIISSEFENKSRVERSQMVHEVLWDFLKTDSIHALRMKLKTPQEV